MLSKVQTTLSTRIQEDEEETDSDDDVLPLGDLPRSSAMPQLSRQKPAGPRKGVLRKVRFRKTVKHFEFEIFSRLPRTTRTTTAERTM